MSLLKKIDENLIKALKAGEKEKVTVLRGLKSDLKYARIAKKDDLTEDESIGVLNSAAKKARDSIEMFKQGERDDLVTQEEFGLAIITEYLPEQLSEDKLLEIIKAAIEETGVETPAKMGLVMKVVMPQVKGKADGKLVNRLVAQLLAQ